MIAPLATTRLGHAPAGHDTSLPLSVDAMSCEANMTVTDNHQADTSHVAPHMHAIGITNPPEHPRPDPASRELEAA